MDHKYRHLSSGLDSDSAKDIFCDPSLSFIIRDDLFKTIFIIIDPNFDISALHLYWEYLYIEKKKTQLSGRCSSS